MRFIFPGERFLKVLVLIAWVRTIAHLNLFVVLDYLSWWVILGRFWLYLIKNGLEKPQCFLIIGIELYLQFLFYCMIPKMVASKSKYSCLASVRILQFNVQFLMAVQASSDYLMVSGIWAEKLKKFCLCFLLCQFIVFLKLLISDDDYRGSD